MNYLYAFLIISICFISCKNEKSQIDYKQKGVLHKANFPDSVIFNKNDFEFRFHIDSNINKYDSSLANNVIKVNAELINNSTNSACFLTSKSGLTCNIIDNIYFSKSRINPTTIYDIIICWNPPERAYITTDRKTLFGFNYQIDTNMKSIDLSFNLNLISNYENLDSVNPYQYIKLESAPQKIPKVLFERAKIPNLKLVKFKGAICW